MSSTYEGSLIERAACLRGGGGLFNLAKFMVSILHNELHGNVKKLRYMDLEAMQPKMKKTNKQTNQNFQTIRHKYSWSGSLDLFLFSSLFCMASKFHFVFYM